MKKSKHIFPGLSIGVMILLMLSSCGLEKRVIVTTRGYEATFPDHNQVHGYELLQDDDSSPRDTVLNYRIK